MRGARGKQNSSRGSRSQNRGPERKFRTQDPGILSHQRQKKRDPKLNLMQIATLQKLHFRKLSQAFQLSC